MLDPLGFNIPQTHLNPRSDAPVSARARELKSPYIHDTVTTSPEKVSDESPLYRYNPALAAHKAEDTPEHASLSTFSRFTLAGLAALSLFGGVIAAEPAAASAMQHLPQSQSTVLPDVPTALQTIATATAVSQSEQQTATKEALAKEALAGETKKVQLVNMNPSKAEIEKKLEDAAARHNVPKAVLKAVAWQETFWEQFTAKGNPTVGHNRNKKGKITSSDWGIMQINDRYHPTAFPKVKTDIDANIDYGAQLLEDLYKQHKSWNSAIKHYNGKTVYMTTVQRHMKKQPWEAAKMAEAKILAAKEKALQLAQDQQNAQKVSTALKIVSAEGAKRISAD